MRLTIVTFTLAFCCLPCGSQPFKDREVNFATEFQNRVFQIRDGVFTTVELQNKFAPSAPLSMPAPNTFRTLRVSSSEFGIYLKDAEPLTAYDFTYSGDHTESTPDGPQFVVRLKGRTVPLDVTLIYSAQTGKPWMRKELRITPNQQSGEDLLIERIDVERFGYPEAHMEGGGIGQPIFLPMRGHFFGLEYPEGHNDHAGVITLSHFPGVRVGTGVASKSAVWGVAPDGQVKSEFLEKYVPSFAVHSPSKPVITFNEAWNSGSSTTETIARQSISVLRKELIDRRGIQVGVYCIDSGWADPASILAVDRHRFPRGFAPVERDASASGMRLGLWASLAGAKLDTHWGIAHGLEAVQANEAFGPYCIAGPKYRAALKAALGYYIDSNHVSSFKFDYNSFDCRQAGHGHPIEPLQAREAAVDGYIDILQFIHKRNPSVRIEITTGMWLSPWWLRYADWVWLGGSDLDFLTPSGIPRLKAGVIKTIPAYGKRADEISYRDSVVWEDLRDKSYAFPEWGLMTHGFYNWLQIGGAPDPEAGIEGSPKCCDEPLSDFADHVVTTLLRGISDWEMLLNLRQMTPEKWNYLARVLKWGQANWDVLSDTQMVLGNPSKFEVYGYVHFRRARAIVSLRNPANIEQKADLGLNAENGFGEMPPGGLHAWQLYSCEKPIAGLYIQGSHLTLTLAPHETKIIELSQSPTDDHKLALKQCQASTNQL